MATDAMKWRSMTQARFISGKGTPDDRKIPRVMPI